MKVFVSRELVDGKSDPPKYIPHTLRYQVTKRPTTRGAELDAWKQARKLARKAHWS